MASTLIISKGERRSSEKFDNFAKRRRELRQTLDRYLSGRYIEINSDTNRNITRRNERKLHHNYYTKRYKGVQARSFGAKLAGVKIKTHEKVERKHYGFATRFRNKPKVAVL